MTTHLSLDLPPEVSLEEGRLALVIGLWLQAIVSQGVAAGLCGLSREDFLTELNRRRLPFTNISAEDLEEEVASWHRADSSSTPPH